MKKLLICNFLKHFTGKFEISNIFLAVPFKLFPENASSDSLSMIKEFSILVNFVEYRKMFINFSLLSNVENRIVAEKVSVL